MATVLSMVASNCMPPIAMIAAMKRREGNQAGTKDLGRSRPAESRRTRIPRSLAFR